MKIRPAGVELFHAEGQTFVFRNFAKVPKNGKNRD